MTRDEAIDAGMTAIHQAINDALGGAYDAGKGDGTPPDVQAQIDAAVKAKADEDAAALADVQTKLDQAMSDDESDKSTIKGLQGIVDSIKAILAPKA